MTKKSTGTALLALALALLVAVFSTLVLTPTSVAAAAGKPSARASHILVPTEEECDEILAELQTADDLESKFAALAKARSKCPSSRKGGDLGSFGRGQMVPEFDMVAFEKPVGVVHKVHTQFGWHLVLTKQRSGMDEDEDVLGEDEDEDDYDHGDL